MSAPTRRPAVIPTQRTAAEAANSARCLWPDPIPANRVWMAGIGYDALHRIERWERAPGGDIHSRCGRAAAPLWLEAHPRDDARRPHCLHCEDANDAL